MIECQDLEDIMAVPAWDRAADRTEGRVWDRTEDHTEGRAEVPAWGGAP